MISDVPTRSRLRLILAVAILSLVPLPATANDPTAGGEGAIEGVVTYKADARRSWRYARYYVKDRQRGFLAEAMVALRGKGLDAAPAETAKTLTMDQKNFQFVPEILAIRAGDAVKFTSRDAETHNVRASGLLASFSANMPRGGDYLHTFARAGGVRRSIKISCVFHGAMRAWIYVYAHPYYQITGSDGQFQLKHVPAGRYNLEMVHPAGELRWRQAVEVKAGQTLRIDIPVSPDYKTRIGK